jgi:hypothetical protein
VVEETRKSAGSIGLSVEITIITGPLGEDLLQAIARMYGSHDKKYSSLSFCRTVFNENPSGYSFHAFAKDDDKIVGHYAVIPVEICARGRTGLSAKGEALFLERDYRSESILNGNKDIPLGIGLAARLYDFALQQDIKVVHVIADSNIGVIHRMAGCTKRVVEQTKSVFILDSEIPGGPDSSPARVWASRVIFLFQHILLSFFCLLSLLCRRSIVLHGKEVDGSETFFERMCNSKDGPAEAETWTIAKNKANLLWFFRTGLLEVVTTDGSAGEYIVTRRNPEPGSDVEIVDSSVSGGTALVVIKLLCGAIARATKEKAGRVVCYSSPSDDKRNRLMPFMRLFGFVSKIEKRPIYLRSTDHFFLDAKSIVFTPFFYCTF